VTPFNGIIDSDYTGQIKVLLFNHNAIDFEVRAGDRIAQLILLPHAAQSISVEQTETNFHAVRGSNGFGSSGL
jgi:dUTP pyrophosphatase